MVQAFLDCMKGFGYVENALNLPRNNPKTAFSCSKVGALRELWDMPGLDANDTGCIWGLYRV